MAIIPPLVQEFSIPFYVLNEIASGQFHQLVESLGISAEPSGVPTTLLILISSGVLSMHSIPAS